MACCCASFKGAGDMTAGGSRFYSRASYSNEWVAIENGGAAAPFSIVLDRKKTDDASAQKCAFAEGRLTRERTSRVMQARVECKKMCFAVRGIQNLLEEAACRDARSTVGKGGMEGMIDQKGTVKFPLVAIIGNASGKNVRRGGAVLV